MISPKLNPLHTFAALNPQMFTPLNPHKKPLRCSKHSESISLVKKAFLESVYIQSYAKKMHKIEMTAHLLSTDLTIDEPSISQEVGQDDEIKALFAHLKLSPSSSEPVIPGPIPMLTSLSAFEINRSTPQLTSLKNEISEAFTALNACSRSISPLSLEVFEVSRLTAKSPEPVNKLSTYDKTVKKILPISLIKQIRGLLACLNASKGSLTDKRIAQMVKVKQVFELQIQSYKKKWGYLRSKEQWLAQMNADGRTLCGRFRRDEFIEGMIFNPDGSIFLGFCRKEVPNGLGFIYYSNDKWGSGQFASGLLHGLGVVKEKERGFFVTYTGLFCRGSFKKGLKKDHLSLSNGYFNGGVLNGNGYQEIYNLVKQKGSFRNGCLIKGERNEYEGSYQAGTFRLNKLHGKGVRIERGVISEGYFKLGKLVESFEARKARNTQLKVHQKKLEKTAKAIEALNAKRVIGESK
jgi:hypothetical protein